MGLRWQDLDGLDADEVTIVIDAARERQRDQVRELRSIKATLINLWSEKKVSLEQLMDEDDDDLDEYLDADQAFAAAAEKYERELEDDSTGWVERLMGDEVQP